MNNVLINRLIEERGYAYALGFVQAQLETVTSMLSAKKQKQVAEDFERSVDHVLGKQNG